TTERRRLRAKRRGRPPTTRLRLTLAFFAHAADGILVEPDVRERARRLIASRPGGERFAHAHRRYRRTTEDGRKVREEVLRDYVNYIHSTPPERDENPLEWVKGKLEELSLDLGNRGVALKSERSSGSVSA